VGGFSSTSNPNGVWQYGSLAGTAFTPLAEGSCGMLSGWQGMSSAPGEPPFVFAGPGTCGATAEAVPSTMLDLHPAQNGDRSVVRWTAPSAGTYTIQGTFVGLDPAPTTTDVHVVLGGVDSFTAQIDSFNVPTPFSLVSVPLTAGEIVDFEVGFGADGNYEDDSTGLAATICQ
jgi:hypothetical protein